MGDVPPKAGCYICEVYPCRVFPSGVNPEVTAKHFIYLWDEPRGILL